MAGLVAPKFPARPSPEFREVAAVAAEPVKATKIITPDQRQEAASRAERIRQGIGDVARLAREAWRNRDWEALGHHDWAAYVAAEFGQDRVGARRAVAALLSGEGLSERDMARETGVPRSTVQRDLGRGVAHSAGHPADQANVTKPVTRKDRAKSTAERVAQHRERKRREGRPVEVVQLPQPTEAPPPAQPAAPAGDELERLREQAREEAKAELRAKFEERWNALVRQRDALRAEAEQLRAEAEALKSGHGTCPQHRAALVTVCPRCEGLEPGEPWSLEE
jgi:hypothetical protein